MEKLQLKTTDRDTKTTNVKKLKKQGLIPAVLYGKGIKNEHFSINTVEFEKLLKKAGESTIIELVTPDGKNHPVLIQDMQRNFLTYRPQHVDFYQVDMSKKLKTSVALEFTGEPKAVKELGGVLVRVLNEVEIECLPTDLPKSIPADISILNTFEDLLKVKDIKVSDKIKILAGPEEVIAKVQPPRTKEEIEVKHEEAVAAVEGAEEEKKEGEETKEGEGENKEKPKEDKAAPTEEKEKPKEEPKK